MIRTRNLTLNNVPQLITISDNVDSPNTIAVQNTHSTAYVYLGSSNVSNSNYGFRIAPNGTFSADFTAYEKLYAVGDSGSTIAVMIMEL